MLGLNPWFIVAGLVSLIAVGGGGYLKGRADCSAKWEYATLQAERDTLLNIIKTEKAARAADAQALSDNEALLRDLQMRAEANEKLLEDPARECFSGNDTDRLRDLFRKAP